MSQIHWFFQWFFIFLSFRENANDKEFSLENSKPRRESRIMTR